MYQLFIFVSELNFILYTTVYISILMQASIMYRYSLYFFLPELQIIINVQYYCFKPHLNFVYLHVSCKHQIEEKANVVGNVLAFLVKI